MIIRTETNSDIAAIRTLLGEAFRGAPLGDGCEADIVDALRSDGALTVSLVACEAEQIVGYVAFSPVVIADLTEGWNGLGPVAVLARTRRRGIAAALIRAGLQRIETIGAKGCVVLGDPAYYVRFGFERDPQVRFDDAPADYFQRLLLNGPPPRGVVRYHPAFYHR